MDTQVTTVSRWPHSEYSRISGANLDNVVYHYVLRVPRNAFRRCATSYMETSRTNEEARYWDMSMQLFIEACRVMEEMGRTSDKNVIPIYPYLKVYLEWVPHDEDPDQAVEYRIHAFSMHEMIRMGDALDVILKSASKLHHEHQNRSSNARGVDPLAGLKPHQAFMRVHHELYYRTICALVRSDRVVENNLDRVMSHGVMLTTEGNPANPESVFSLTNAIRASNKAGRNVPPVFKLTKSYQRGDIYDFPDYSRVIRLTPGQLQTSAFLSKYLPEYQAWVEKSMPVEPSLPPPDAVEDEDPFETPELASLVTIAERDEPAVQDSGFSKGTLLEYDTRSAADVERDRISLFAPRSDLELMERRAKEQYKKDVSEHERTGEYYPAYRKYQEWCIKELEARCWTPDAHISVPGAAMLNWFQYVKPKSQAWRMEIKGMSVFANRVIRMFQQMEHYLMVSTQHRSVYLALHARYDAYRYSRNLHLNLFWTGEGATSKSFVLDTMKNNSIPNTVEQLTYQTAKADAVDGDRDDQIVVYHEAPPGLFHTARNKNLDSSAEAMFKEMLTSQTTTVKTIYIDETTGKRAQRVVKSSCIGVRMAATNDDPSDVEEALKTRFFWGNFEKTQRAGRDIDDCMNGSRNMNEQDKQYAAAFRQSLRVEQYRVYLVENMIRIGAIRDVNMDVANILLPLFKMELQRRGIQVAGARDWERVKILARSQAIVTAIDIVFNMEDSRYNGVEFEAVQLLDIEPYLFVTEEMLMFTLTLLSNQFHNPVQHKVLSKIYHMKKDEINAFGNDQTGISRSYIKLKSMHNLTKILQSNLNMSEGKTSQHNIAAVLNDLSRESFLSRSFNNIPDNVKGFPEENMNSQESRQQCVHIQHDGVYVHVGQLLRHSGRGYDPVLEAIKEMNFSTSVEKKIIVARPVKGKPHVMQVVDRKVGVKKLQFNNVLYNTAISRRILGTASENNDNRKRRRIEFSIDVDDHARIKRATLMGVEAIAPVVCSEGSLDFKSISTELN